MCISWIVRIEKIKAVATLQFFEIVSQKTRPANGLIIVLVHIFLVLDDARGGMANISASEIRTWLATAPAGAEITYFRGFLAWAKEAGDGLNEANWRELITVGDFLWKAAQHGHVHLVQIRHGVGDYAYVAIARGCRGGNNRKATTFAVSTVEPPS